MSMDTHHTDGEDVEPACQASLTGTDSRWTTADPTAFPQGYPRLCQDCFDEAELDDNGHAQEFDHTNEVNEFVKSTGSNTASRMHRPRNTTRRGYRP